MADLTTCSFHKDTTAETFCLEHFDFQCVSCVIECIKSKDCNIVELTSSHGEREQCLIKLANSKQRTIHLQDHNSAEMSSLNGLKNRLMKEIDDHHMKLASRLEKMVTSTKESMEDQAGIIEKKIMNENDALDECKNDIEAKLKTLTNKKANLEDILQDLDDINVRIDKISNKPELEINGSFELNKSISNNMTVLGQVKITQQNRYEVCYVRVTQTTEQDQEATCSSIENTEQKVQDNANAPQCTVVEDVEPLNDQGSWFCNLFKKRPSPTKREDVKIDETQARQLQSDTIITEQQQQQQRQQQQQEERQQQEQQHHIIDIGNQRVKIPDLKSDSSIRASKCEQLVHMGGNYVCMMSTSLSTVFITVLPHGPSFRKTFPGSLSGITSVGPKDIAVLKENAQINVFTLDGNKLTSSGSNVLTTETVTDISGFSYNVQRTTYAISSPTKCVILEKICKVIKTFSIPQINIEDPGSIRSVYDFESEQIIYLNTVDKTLTAFSCKKEQSKMTWNKTINEENFTPRSMCLYKDVICVASRDSISTFSREDGKHVKNIETCSILSDCLAVCGVDGLLMWTSDSDEPELSESIGLVKL